MSTNPVINYNPVHNEEENLELYKVYTIFFTGWKTYEIIYVDDGSTDDSFEKIKALRIQGLNCVSEKLWKAAALSCGFKIKRILLLQWTGICRTTPRDTQIYRRT